MLSIRGLYIKEVVLVNKVRMFIHLAEGYDENAIDYLIEDSFPEADLWYADREIRFRGTLERSQELLLAVETICKHDRVRVIREYE